MRFLDLAFVIRLGEGEAQGALKEGQSIEDQEEKKNYYYVIYFLLICKTCMSFRVRPKVGFPRLGKPT